LVAASADELQIHILLDTMEKKLPLVHFGLAPLDILCQEHKVN
jgi:hypothetical protein